MPAPTIVEVEPVSPASDNERQAWRSALTNFINALATIDSAGSERSAASDLAREFERVIEGKSVLIRLGDETAGAADRQANRLFLEKAVNIAADIAESRQEEAIAKLADLILPDALADARGPIAVDNLALRDRFVAETGPLTSSQVAELAGYAGVNPYATAGRWKRTGAIFSVHHRGTEYFPGFQFQDGKPHPVIRKLLGCLPGRMSPWQKAFWFVSSNGWLNDKAPAEVMADEAAVLSAARREADETIG